MGTLIAQEARAVSDPATRKAIFEKIAAKYLAEGSMIYLYHPQMLIAHTDRLENYRPMPDGLVRVIGLKRNDRRICLRSHRPELDRRT